MDKKQIKKTISSFDDIAQHTEDGVEFWYARDLMPHLGYDRWENFDKAIKRAIESCKTAQHSVSNHFREVTNMIRIRKVKIWQLYLM